MVVATFACGAPPEPRTLSPPPPSPSQPALPAGFSLDLVVPLKPGGSGRLRLDDAGRPYVVTKDTLLPAQRLPDGTPAKPFKLANAPAIEDVAWADDGVVLVVVGSELGVIGPEGFVAILALPGPGMRVVHAAPGQVWLFAPGDRDGRLYLYDKAGTVAELARVGVPIRAVSGSPASVFVAAGGSLVRIAGTSRQVELLLTGREDILAVGATPNGVFLSTSAGTFFRSDGGIVTRITRDGALAIQTHGEDIYLHLAAIGIVHGTPVSAVERATPEPTVVTTIVAPAPPPRGMTGRRKAAVVLGVGGLALLGVGAGFAISANRGYDDAHASGHCDDRTICDDIGYAQVENAHAAARKATITAVSGAGLVGVAAVLWLTGGRAATESGTALLPRVSTHDVGLAIGRRF
jgi:hypothetical protein